MSNEVTKAKGTAVSADLMDDIFESAGEGASFDSSEMQIPFVRLVQALSPQINKKKLIELMATLQLKLLIPMRSL